MPACTVHNQQQRRSDTAYLTICCSVCPAVKYPSSCAPYADNELCCSICCAKSMSSLVTLNYQQHLLCAKYSYAATNLTFDKFSGNLTDSAECRLIKA